MKVGSEVKLQTVDGQFGGIVQAVNQQQQYLILRDGNIWWLFTVAQASPKPKHFYSWLLKRHRFKKDVSFGGLDDE